MAQRAAEAGITVPLSFLDGADVDAVRGSLGLWHYPPSSLSYAAYLTQDQFASFASPPAPSCAIASASLPSVSSEHVR